MDKRAPSTPGSILARSSSFVEVPIEWVLKLVIGSNAMIKWRQNKKNTKNPASFILRILLIQTQFSGPESDKGQGSPGTSTSPSCHQWASRSAREPVANSLSYLLDVHSIFIINYCAAENWFHFFLGLENNSTKEPIAGFLRESYKNVTCELSGLKSMFFTQDFCSKIWQKTR